MKEDNSPHTDFNEEFNRSARSSLPSHPTLQFKTTNTCAINLVHNNPSASSFVSSVRAAPPLLNIPSFPSSTLPSPSSVTVPVIAPHIEVERRRDVRDSYSAYSCFDCDQFHQQHPTIIIPQCTHIKTTNNNGNNTMNSNNNSNNNSSVSLLQSSGSHRSRYDPPASPPDYWKLSQVNQREIPLYDPNQDPNATQLSEPTSPHSTSISSNTILHTTNNNPISIPIAVPNPVVLSSGSSSSSSSFPPSSYPADFQDVHQGVISIHPVSIGNHNDTNNSSSLDSEVQIIG